MSDLKVEMIKVKKDYYTLKINDKEVGTYERSQYRLILSVIDDAITSGLVDDLGKDDEPMSQQQFMEMLEQSRKAAQDDDGDCLMCGS